MWGAPQAFARARPQLMLFELLELWPHWVKACERAGVPSVVVNARVSPRTLYARPLLKPTFERLSLVLAQTPLDAERAVWMGAHPSRVQCLGNSKYDALLGELLEGELLEGTLLYERPLQLIFGALRPEDERALIALAPQLKGQRVLIAPRYPQRAQRLAHALSARGLRCALRSEQPELSALEWLTREAPHATLILDTLGELRGLYAHSVAAILGGSFTGRSTGSPQSMIEAARAGCVIAYGPRAKRLPLELNALREPGAQGFNTAQEATRWALAASPLSAQALTQRAEALRALTGAAERQWRALSELL